MNHRYVGRFINHSFSKAARTIAEHLYTCPLNMKVGVVYEYNEEEQELSIIKITDPMTRNTYLSHNNVLYVYPCNRECEDAHLCNKRCFIECMEENITELLFLHFYEMMK